MADKKKEEKKVLVAVQSIGLPGAKGLKGKWLPGKSYSIGDVIEKEDIKVVEKMHKIFVPNHDSKNKDGKWDGSGNWIDSSKAKPVVKEMSLDKAKDLAKENKELIEKVAKAKKEREEKK